MNLTKSYTLRTSDEAHAVLKSIAAEYGVSQSVALTVILESLRHGRVVDLPELDGALTLAGDNFPKGRHTTKSVVDKVNKMSPDERTKVLEALQ